MGFDTMPEQPDSFGYFERASFAQNGNPGERQIYKAVGCVGRAYNKMDGGSRDGRGFRANGNKQTP